MPVLANAGLLNVPHRYLPCIIAITSTQPIRTVRASTSVFTAPIRSAALALCACVLAACSDQPAPRQVAGGDAAIGKQLVEQYQCGACHVIPGTRAAQGQVGPSLAAFGRRGYIAGSIPNLPEALVQWLVDPPAVKPGTGMPNLSVSAQDARHMAAYLYSVDED